MKFRLVEHIQLQENVSRDNPYLPLALTIFENDEDAKGIIVSARAQGSSDQIKICKTFKNDAELQKLIKLISDKYGKISDFSVLHDRSDIDTYKRMISDSENKKRSDNQTAIDNMFNKKLEDSLSANNLRDLVDELVANDQDKWFALYNKYIPEIIPANAKEQDRIITLLIEALKKYSNNDTAAADSSPSSSNISETTLAKFIQLCLSLGKQLFFKDSNNQIKRVNPKKYSNIKIDQLANIYISRTGKEGTDLISVLDNLKNKNLIEELEMKFKLVEAAESKICCICKKPFDGYGNNAEPVCAGSCCDECNMKEVIPARLRMLDNSSAEDIDEAVLNETDESGNDEMDANCDDCGAVITIPIDHEGPAYCANCMKNHLHESLEDYKLTYYLSTATAERRPETMEDFENDWIEETFAADSDLDACKYAYEQIQMSYMDDFDFKNVADFVEYCEMKDLGDGSPFIVKLEGPNGVIYDMGQTKDDFIEQIKQNDEMLAYYRGVLGIDESLNENAVSSKIPEAIDQFLQDIAQMYQTISYKDIMDHDYTSEDLQKLAKLRGKFRREINYVDSGDEEAAAICEKIANDVAEILKSDNLEEAIDPSKALEVKKNSDADVIFYGYQYKNEKPVEFDPPRELSSDEYKAEVQTIVDSKTKLNPDKPTSNRYGYDHDFIFYALYNRKNESNEKDDNKMNEDMSIRAKLKALYPELNFGDAVVDESLNEEVDSEIAIPTPYDKYFEIIEVEYDEDDDYSYKPGDKIDDVTILADVAAKDEWADQFDSIYSLTDDSQFPIVEIVHDRLYLVELPEDDLNEATDNQISGQMSFFDDDMNFDIEEDAGIHRMNTLYKGTDFDDHDDEILTEEFGDDDDWVYFHYDEDRKLYVGSGEIVTGSGKTLKAAVEACKTDAENYDSSMYSSVEFDESNIDWDEEDLEELGYLNVTWVENNDNSEDDDYDDAFDEDLDEDLNAIPESDEEHGKYIWKISFDNASGEYEATNDVDDIYASGNTLEECIANLRSLVNELGEMDGSPVKKFSDKHVDYSESDLDNLGYVIVKYGRFRFW